MGKKKQGLINGLDFLIDIRVIMYPCPLPFIGDFERKFFLEGAMDDEKLKEDILILSVLLFNQGFSKPYDGFLSRLENGHLLSDALSREYFRPKGEEGDLFCVAYIKKASEEPFVCGIDVIQGAYGINPPRVSFKEFLRDYEKQSVDIEEYFRARKLPSVPRKTGVPFEFSLN